jgi:transcriptional regulator with XRE-family HTH domain
VYNGQKTSQETVLDKQCSSVICCAPTTANEHAKNTTSEPTFGATLYCLRRIADLQQEEVARKSGLSRAYYGQLENSKRPPPPHHTIERIANALGLGPAQRDELLRTADTDRCRVTHMPAGLPLASQKILQTLAATITKLSADQVRQISEILEGGSNS